MPREMEVESTGVGAGAGDGLNLYCLTLDHAKFINSYWSDGLY